MALDQSALTDLLEALRSGGDPDFMREACRGRCSSCCRPSSTWRRPRRSGAARYERTDNRSTHRNGSRSRLLSTKAGDVELAIPKLRHGSFFPALLEPRRRIDRALVGIFPNEAGVLRLAGSIVLEVRAEWQIVERRYLSEGLMAKLYETDNDGAERKEVGTDTKELLVVKSRYPHDTLAPVGGRHSGMG